MPIHSKNKGSAFERYTSQELKKFGYDAYRSQQYCGAKGDADVIAPSFPFHIECKRIERLNINKALEQATRDSRGKPPCVIHKKNRGETLFTCRLEDLLNLLKNNE